MFLLELNNYTLLLYILKTYVLGNYIHEVINLMYYLLK